MTPDRVLLVYSMLASLLFWLAVKLTKDYRTSGEVRLQWELPDTLAFAKPVPSSLFIVIEGKGVSLFRGLSNEVITVGPTLLHPGENIIGRRQLLPLVQQRLPEGLNIIDLSPDHLSVPVEVRQEKHLPVYPHVTPDLPPGFVLKGDITARPDSAIASGPQSIIQNLRFASTEKWNPQNLEAGEYSRELALTYQDSIVSFTPPKVTVSFEVEPITEKSFFVPILPKNAKDSIRIFPGKVKITFAVPASKFDSVTPADFELAADFSQVKTKESNTLPIEVVKKPAFITNLNFRPNSIEFFIQNQ